MAVTMKSIEQEVRKLFGEARTGVTLAAEEAGVEARGRATRRSVGYGRYRQPVSEWTFTDIEKGLQSALTQEMGRIGTQEAGVIGELYKWRAEEESYQDYLDEMSEQSLLQSIIEGVSMVAPMLPWKDIAKTATGAGRNIYTGAKATGKFGADYMKKIFGLAGTGDTQSTPLSFDLPQEGYGGKMDLRNIYTGGDWETPRKKSILDIYNY